MKFQKRNVIVYFIKKMANFTAQMAHFFYQKCIFMSHVKIYLQLSSFFVNYFSVTFNYFRFSLSVFRIKYSDSSFVSAGPQLSTADQCTIISLTLWHYYAQRLRWRQPLQQFHHGQDGKKSDRTNSMAPHHQIKSSRRTLLIMDEDHPKSK